MDHFKNNNNKKIVGKSFPARASVILHYFSNLEKNTNNF